MLDKFQCSYELMINWTDKNGQPKQMVISDPITIDFSIIKSTQSENSTRINVYNMDGARREEIHKDIVLLVEENPNIMWVTLEAGYAGRRTLVSWGYIQQCFTVRKGTDMVTTIDVVDPDILTEYTGVTFKEGTTFKQAYDYLVAQLPSLKVGETGVLQGEFKVPTVFDGNTFVLLNRLTGGHTFVDNKIINTLGDNETLSDYGCYYIAAETGLLDTPKRYNNILEVQMLFEPTIKLGQLVEIKSSSQARFDGQFKVLGINHNCLISGAIEGTRTTTLQLEYIEGWVNSNVNLTNNPTGSSPAMVVNNKIEPINTKVGSDAKAIYDYIMKHNGQLPSDRKNITNRISWKEMLYPTGTDNKPTDVKKHITPGILQNCINIAEKLTNFVNRNFPKGTLKIDSGYRTPENRFNRRGKEGELLNSNHLNGTAIDFKLDNISLRSLKERIKNPAYWGYGRGVHYNNFVHVSLNPKEKF